ncbi:MAG TPA: PEGA domain-containing protein, partial [Polyangiaceae bacterium]|nr:PEGA domain-containing protein [Polyangiaceae bacterium]
MRRNVSLKLTQIGVAAALAGALLVAAPPAAAQDEATLTMARERFKEGVTYFDKKDFAKARVAFLQAYALKKHPAVLLNLAQSELRSGHEADAAGHFAQYLREHKDASDSERQGAETGLAAAKAQVGELTLEVEPSGAEVLVDGELAGAAPLPGAVFLMPGSHHVQARKDGKTANNDVALSAGQSTKLTLKITSSAPPAATTEVATSPLPPTEREAEPGPVVEAEPQSRKSFPRWLASTPGAIVGVGLTGVGLVGGGAFAIGSKAAYDAADSVGRQIGDQALRDGKAVRSGACYEPNTWLGNIDRWSGDGNAEIRADRAGQYKRNCD